MSPLEKLIDDAAVAWPGNDDEDLTAYLARVLGPRVVLRDDLEDAGYACVGPNGITALKVSPTVPQVMTTASPFEWRPVFLIRESTD